MVRVEYQCENLNLETHSELSYLKIKEISIKDHIEQLNETKGKGKMDGYQYEKKCAKLLEKKGFTDVHVTQSSGDQGIDVVCYKNGEKYGVQCKYYEGTVGNKAVQEVYAGTSFYDCDKALVITNSILTNQAHMLASKLSVEIWEGINAIYLQQELDNEENITIPKISLKEYNALSQSEKDAYNVKIIEALIKQESVELYKKYPFDEVAFKKIELYADDIKKCVDELYESTGKKISSPSIEVTKIRSTGIIKPTSEYKKAISQYIKDFGIELKRICDKVVEYICEYTKGPFSLQSLHVLIELLFYIKKTGDKMKVTIGKYNGIYNNETIFNGVGFIRTRFRYQDYEQEGVWFTFINLEYSTQFAAVVCIDDKPAPGVLFDERREKDISPYLPSHKIDNKVADFSWPEKYKRKFSEWREFEETLPKDPVKEMEKLESREKSRLSYVICSKKETIKSLNKELKEITTKADQCLKKLSSTKNMDVSIKEELKKSRDKIYDEYLKNKVALDERIEKLKTEIDVLEQDKKQNRAEYNNTMALKFLKRKELNDLLVELNSHINKFKDEINGYSDEIKKLQQECSEKIRSAEMDMNRQISEANSQRISLTTAYNSAKNDIESISLEISKLNVELEKAEKNLEKFHEVFILNNYRDKYKGQLVLLE